MDDQNLDLLFRIVSRSVDDEYLQRRLLGHLAGLYEDVLPEMLGSLDLDEDLPRLAELVSREPSRSEDVGYSYRVVDAANELRTMVRSDIGSFVESWEPTAADRNAAMLMSLLDDEGVEDPFADVALETATRFAPQIEEVRRDHPSAEIDEQAGIKELFSTTAGSFGSGAIDELRETILNDAGGRVASQQRAVAEEIRSRATFESGPKQVGPLPSQGKTSGVSAAAQEAERQEIQAQIDALSNRTLPPIAQIQDLYRQLAEVGSGRGTPPPVNLRDANSFLDTATGRAAPPPVSSGAANEALDKTLPPKGDLSPDMQAAMDYIAQLEAQLNSGPSGPSGPRRLSAAEEREANEAEIKALLAEQFGGFGFFLQDNLSSLYVGLTADGTIVDHADPAAVTVKNVLDVIVDKGIIDPTRVLGILEKTEWWQTTDVAARKFDATWFGMSEPARAESLEPITLALDDEAQFLGFELAPDRAFTLAKQIAREGKTSDVDYIRRLMVAEGAFDAVGTEISAFGAARDQLQQMASQYFVPIDDAAAASFAEEIYTGERAAEEMEQYFKMQATARFPTLEKAINELGITPEQYFSPYKYQIEQMLDRPNVDILNDFSEVIEYIPDGAGGSAPRPMTLAEMRTFVRGTDEWQASTQGQDQAQALAHAIGRTFGEVA